MLMTREYEKTLKLLEGARAASPASGVLLSYIRACCFAGVGDLQRAEELYRAVAENGNTHARGGKSPRMAARARPSRRVGGA